MMDNGVKIVGGWLYDNIVAVVAVLLSLPALIALLINVFNTANLEILAPKDVHIRANLPICWREPPLPDGCGKPNPDEKTPNALMQDIVLIFPVSYINTGDNGENLFVVSERVVITNADGKEIMSGEVKYNTELAPRRVNHFNLGEVTAWLPFTIQGGGHRSSMAIVILGDESAPNFQDVIGVMVALGSTPLNVKLIVTTMEDEEPYISDICTLDPAQFLQSLDSDISNIQHYWRESPCDPITAD